MSDYPTLLAGRIPLRSKPFWVGVVILLREAIGALGDLELILRQYFPQLLTWLSHPVARLLFIAVGVGSVWYAFLYPPEAKYFRKRQRRSFVNHLQSKDSIGEVEVRAVPDPEAREIAHEIRGMLEAAGIPTKYWSVNHAKIPYGISINVENEDVRPAEVQALRQAFSNAGLAVKLQYRKPIPKFKLAQQEEQTAMPKVVEAERFFNTVMIEVGYRP